MGPEPGAEPAGAPAEEQEPPGSSEGHRVAPRRPDGPPLDTVAPLIPPEREHHGG